MERLRSQLIELTRKYRTSWFPDLGRSLYQVKHEKLYRNWLDKNGRNFSCFSQYCIHDLHISSTVASDMAIAYRYIATLHKELIGKFPSDGKIPGYNDIVILLRARDKIPDEDFRTLEEMLFTDKIGRDRLRKELGRLLPGRESRVWKLEEEIRMLKTKIWELEAELEMVRRCGVAGFTGSEINRIRRGVARFIHPDVGGDNNLMRDFNQFIDKLIARVSEN